ncbi:MAG TPA: protein kinase [Micromonosporaceae bacterium]|nr:protein kinase [Micromonosporaceae bacterium]
MTQVGEGQEAEEGSPPVTTLGPPSAGEILAERYELTEHVNDDSAGRQVWRGVDVVLRRPVAVVMRYPGGDSAMEMLQAAVAASRVIHPNLVGVYDAIDEGERAYVVREWVEGTSLRDTVSTGPLDATHATTVTHSVCGAVAAVHATGMVHGNVHPGTVLIADDGRVVLADARADGGTPESDVRAVGGVLYFALTGHWPEAETGRSAGVRDAVRDNNGTLAAPRQVRAGVPTYLDDLTVDLLDPALTPPAADVLAAELGRLDAASEEQFLDDVGPLRFAAADDDPPPLSPRSRRRLLGGVAGLLVIALTGLIIGINALAGGENRSASGSTPTADAGTTPDAADTPAAVAPKPVAIDGDQVRIIDPDGNGTELEDAENVVDGDDNTSWDTERYFRSANFGNKKAGMGVLLDLGQPREVSDVQVQLSTRGASLELRAGSTDPGEGRRGDRQIVSSYTRIGEPYDAESATKVTFSGFQPGQKFRYLLVWITKLAPTDDGRYKIGVQEVTVQAR